MLMSSKHQPNNSANVLRRPVEAAVYCVEKVHVANVGEIFSLTMLQECGALEIVFFQETNRVASAYRFF